MVAFAERRACANKFKMLTKRERGEVLNFMDSLVAKRPVLDENGFTMEEVAELLRRKADLDAGNGKVHELLEPRW